MIPFHFRIPAGLFLLAATWLNCQNLRAVNYEVYPGSAFYMDQLVNGSTYPYLARYANGYYFHPVGFGSSTLYHVLTEAEKQQICNNFSNRFAMVEGDMGTINPNADIGDINSIKSYGLTPISAFVNQPADTIIWKQLVANNGALNTPSYEMLAPWDVVNKGTWSSPNLDYARSNMLVWGCPGSGIDSPVNGYVGGINGVSSTSYQQAVWDQCKWTKNNGKKFNYLASPNSDSGQQFLLDMQYVARSLEDHASEPNVYGVVEYGNWQSSITPDTMTTNGVVQANYSLFGGAYYLLKHRDGEPGTLDLYATSNGVNYAQGVMSPILTNAAQIIPFNPAQTNQFTLTLTNLSPWLDYAAVLRARTAQAANWNISFKIGTTDITGSVLNKSGYEFLSSKRLLPNTAQSVTVTLSPKVLGAPTPLDLVIEALPHSGVDQALDTIAFQYQTNQSPPTLNFPTNDWFTRPGLATAPIWFTVGDAETIASNLTVTAVSSNTTLVPNGNIVFGKSGVQRWVNLTPVSGNWGVAPITLIVSDGQFSVSNTFNVFVQQTNIFPYVKANNTVNLELTNSWVTNDVPDQFGLAIWSNTVTAANTTTLGADTDWAGIQIKNPGGLVTINGVNTLGLENAGVDLSGASQSLTLNCPVSLNDIATWNIASGRTVTVNSSISGVGVLTKSGLGTLTLASPNTYSGGTTISSSAGATNALLVANSQALGTGTVTIGGSGGTDGSCLRLAGGITFTNTLVTWNSRTVNSPNILNVSGNNTVSSAIVVGGSDSQSTLQSDSGDLIMLGTIGPKQLILQGAGNGELRGVVGSGTWSLVKSGTGTWTLSADNPYTSATTISGGRLVGAVAGSCSNSAVTVNNTTGCSLGVLITDNTKQWTCDGLTFAGTKANLDFNFGYTVAPSTSVAPLQVNGNVTFTGTPGVTIEAGALPVGPGTYPLLIWTGTTSGTAPTTATLPPHVVGTLSVVGSTLQLNITQNNQEPLTWNAGTNIWDINSTGNWKDALGATGQKYLEPTLPGDDVVFNDAGLDGTVTLNTTVTPASVTVTNTLDYTIAGSGGIAGSTGLAKTGSGKLILATANTYSGATTLGGGTLQIGNGGTAGTLGSGNVVVTAAGTTLAFSRTDSVASPLMVNNQIYGGASSIPKIVVNSGAVQLGGAADNSYATADVKSGGTLILAKPSTSSWHCLGGASTVESGGTLQLAGSGGEQIYSAVTLTVQSGGVFDLSALSEGFATVNLAGTGISNGGALINGDPSAVSTLTANVVLTANSSLGGSGDLILPSGKVISGNFGLTKVGPGTLTLGGTNTYAGNTTVNAGTLVIKLATFATNSIITVATNAVLQLDFTVTNKVQSLVLNGVSRVPGFYNSSTGSPYLTGSGTLQVTGSTNAALASLAVNPPAGQLPNFATTTYSYTVTNAFTNNPVTVTATSVDTAAALQWSFNGTLVGPLTNNVASPNQPLTLAKANTVAVRVVSPNSTVTNFYTVNLLLQPSQAAFTLTNGVSGGTNLVLNWPADHTGYRLLVQTNHLSQGVSNNTNDWGALANYSTTNAAVIPILNTNLNQYFRLVYP